MIWPVAMMLLPIVLFLGQWDGAKLRVWLVMLAAWLAGMSAVHWSSNATPVLAWVIIDIVAAFAVLKRPSGLAQKLIGCTFVMMIAWHSGFSLSGHGDVDLYINFQSVLGWAQWLILLLWGVVDAGKYFGVRPWRAGHQETGGEIVGAKRK